jgi:exodeoxyribonuclease VII small subunit
MTETRRPRIDLEKALSELEEIIEQLESGDLPLEKSLKQFERGVRLSRECQSALKDAEQRVQVLMGSELKDLDAETLAALDEESGEPDEEDEN